VMHTSCSVEHGYAALPQAPGLGVELDEAEAAKHPYRADFRSQHTFADGSVADA